MRRGLAVRVRRTELEKKSTEVAFKVGITREYLRLIEAGKAKNPSIEVMKNLAAELQSDVQTLFFSFDDFIIRLCSYPIAGSIKYGKKQDNSQSGEQYHLCIEQIQCVKQLNRETKSNKSMNDCKHKGHIKYKHNLPVNCRFNIFIIHSHLLHDFKIALVFHSF